MTTAPAAPDRDAYEGRRTAVLRRVRVSGIARSTIARHLGYTGEGGAVYVRRVLNGQDTSAPMLDRIEIALGEIDAAEAQTAEGR